MKVFKGLPASPGIARGQLWFFSEQCPTIYERKIDAELVPHALESFDLARSRVDAHLQRLYESVLARQGESEAEIFASHRELLDDEEFIGDVRHLIEQDLLHPTMAVKQYLDQAAETMRALDDPYLRERAAEFMDLQKNLLLALNGLPFSALSNVPHGSIVVAEDLTPSETAQLDVNDVVGFVLERGGLTSHVAILARNLGLPAVMGLNHVMSAGQNGDEALIDGSVGVLVYRPDAETVAQYDKKAAALAALKDEYNKLYGAPAVSTDGRRVALYSNIGSVANLHLVDENGSEGIGLFRSEFLFMESSRPPSEEEQFSVYRQVLQGVNGKPVVLRLLDIGGDKPLPYMDFQEEDNPFLGWRGVRLYADNPDIFYTQIRAALRAAVFGDLRLMIPMVIHPDEVMFVKQAVQEQAALLSDSGVEIRADIAVGIMVETPAAALMAAQLAQVSDFFSIGTNDLTQYTLAVDRGNTRIASLYDGLHPAVLRLMDMTAKAAHDAGIEVGICGEMGGQTEATPLLLGMGIDELSISGLGVAAVKYLIRNLSYADCRTLLDKAIACRDAKAVRQLLAEVVPQKA